MLNRDFREFIELLNRNEVRYLVVGGYAVGLHGYPRYTKDIDIWIEATGENADRILLALQQFGFGTPELKPEDFLEPDMVIQLGYAPVRIDLLTSLPGVQFAECYPKRVTETMDDLEIHFIDRESLVLNKKASGRLQDLADAEKLEHS